MSEQSNQAEEVGVLNPNNVVLRNTSSFKLLTIQEMHENRSRIVMPKMSLLERIRQQLTLRFRTGSSRGPAFDSPSSYEIEIIPGSLKQRFTERPANKKAGDNKRVHTSSNLG